MTGPSHSALRKASANGRHPCGVWCCTGLGVSLSKSSREKSPGPGCGGHPATSLPLFPACPWSRLFFLAWGTADLWTRACPPQCVPPVASDFIPATLVKCLSWQRQRGACWTEVRPGSVRRWPSRGPGRSHTSQCPASRRCWPHRRHTLTFYGPFSHREKQSQLNSCWLWGFGSTLSTSDAAAEGIKFLKCGRIH